LPGRHAHDRRRNFPIHMIDEETSSRVRSGEKTFWRSHIRAKHLVCVRQSHTAALFFLATARNFIHRNYLFATKASP